MAEQNFVIPHIPGYDLIKRLGQGGMGSVFLAHRQNDGKEVAIKVVNEQVQRVINSSLRKRFLREIDACKRFAHPNVVMLIDGSPGDGECPAYFACEYLEGSDLREIGKSKLVDGTVAKDYMCQLCDGLTYIHGQGYIHRDIKPANIITSKDDRVVLVDFGLVYDAELTRMTATNEAVGTFAFFAPEQLRGEVSEQTDIFQLGATFYWLTTGKHPYDYDQVLAMALGSEVEAPPTPIQLVPSLSKEISNAIMRAIAPHSEQRYRSAEELKSYLEGAPLDAEILSSPALKKRAPMPTMIALLAVIFLSLFAHSYLSSGNVEKELAARRNLLLESKGLPTADEFSSLGSLVKKSSSFSNAESVNETPAFLGHLYLVDYCMKRRRSKILLYLLPFLETYGRELSSKFEYYFQEAVRISSRENRTNELVLSMDRYHEWSEDDDSAFYFAKAVNIDFLARDEDKSMTPATARTIDEALKILRPIVCRPKGTLPIVEMYLELLRCKKTTASLEECRKFMSEVKDTSAEVLSLASAVMRRKPRDKEQRKREHLSASLEFLRAALSKVNDRKQRLFLNLELAMLHAMRNRPEDGKAVLDKLDLNELPPEERWRYFHAKADVHWKANEYKLCAEAFEEVLKLNPPKGQRRGFLRRLTEAKAQAAIFIGR